MGACRERCLFGEGLRTTDFTDRRGWAGGGGGHIWGRFGRRTIDGRRADRGVIQRRRVPALPGLPEAVALYRAGVPVTLTFETPSEMEFGTRVRAHAAFVEAVAEWVETGN